MRPFVVKFLSEFIESFLLLKQVLGTGRYGFEFQRSMHSLVPSVLLRISRLNAF